MMCYAPYIAAQFHPRFYTLIPVSWELSFFVCDVIKKIEIEIWHATIKCTTYVQAGILVGLGAAPMWASKATYLTQLGQVYAKITEQAVEAIIVRFFGFFFLGELNSLRLQVVALAFQHEFNLNSLAIGWALGQLDLLTGALVGRTWRRRWKCSKLLWGCTRFVRCKLLCHSDNWQCESRTSTRLGNLHHLIDLLGMYCRCCGNYCTVHGSTLTIWWTSTWFNHRPGSFRIETRLGQF